MGRGSGRAGEWAGAAAGQGQGGDAACGWGEGEREGRACEWEREGRAGVRSCAAPGSCRLATVPPSPLLCRAQVQKWADTAEFCLNCGSSGHGIRGCRQGLKQGVSVLLGGGAPTTTSRAAMPVPETRRPGCSQHWLPPPLCPAAAHSAASSSPHPHKPASSQAPLLPASSQAPPSPVPAPAGLLPLHAAGPQRRPVPRAVPPGAAR